MIHYKNLNVLVTGSNGFIGNGLVRKLMALGSNVYEADLENGIDITNLDSLLKFKKIDLVFHLAAKTFVPDSWSNPIRTYEINTIGTLNILEFCRRSNSKLIFPSTYVYGNPKYLPVDETHPVESTNPYSESKIAAERLCIFYKEKYNLDVKILRLFNIYGIGQDSNFLIPKIIEQAFLGEINLENSTPKRDFVYLDDVISAHIKAGSVNHKEKIIFNIGSGKSTSVDKVAKLIAKKIGNDIKINYSGNVRKGEISNTIANIKLSQDVLEWAPSVDIESGINYCIEDYKKNVVPYNQ